MIPVMQTMFAGKDPHGNCASACLASILEIPLEEVPDFFLVPGGEFQNSITKFIESLGRQTLYMQVDVDSRCFEGLYFWGSKAMEMPCMISGHSPRCPGPGNSLYPLFHAVVGVTERYGVRYLHDPHPDGTFITGLPTAIRWII